MFDVTQLAGLVEAVETAQFLEQRATIPGPLEAALQPPAVAACIVVGRLVTVPLSTGQIGAVADALEQLAGQPGGQRALVLGLEQVTQQRVLVHLGLQLQFQLGQPAGADAVPDQVEEVTDPLEQDAETLDVGAAQPVQGIGGGQAGLRVQ